MKTPSNPPIHLGSGEPVVLLHPFLCSQKVWTTVAEQLAATGRYEVFAPTLAGHHGGPKSGSWLLDIDTLVGIVEEQLDGLGWDTAHIVGNSLGGWAAFELERRGRARSLTAIAPGGGWTRWSPAKFETIARFLLLGPGLLVGKLIGPKILNYAFGRRLATLAVSGDPEGPRRDDLVDLLDDATHCPAFLQMLIRTAMLPGLLELAQSEAPTQLVVCEKDRVFPGPRGNKYFRTHLPEGSTVIELPKVGHVPMLEAPARITELIATFVDRHTEPDRAEPTAV